MKEKLNILVVGGGGREHAIAWKLAQSPLLQTLYIAPGNAGTAQIGTNVPIKADDIPALLRFAQENAIGLTVVGPEAPLAAGIVDAFSDAGLKIFGPTRAAAQLEASKAFSKAFMQAHAIPTATYATFDRFDAARQYVLQQNRPLVVKADGLAAGKGVSICLTAAEAERALTQMMQDGVFGEAGNTVVIEELMTGAEVSILAFCDGKTVIPMPPARDHKRIFDHDEGPNTGGMGAFAPAPDIDAALIESVQRTILQPTIDGMAAQGHPYIGVLYAGLMLTPDGVRTLEFNCRFGDPETQAILPLLATDLVEIMLACIDRTLDRLSVAWHDGAAAAVVVASPGYPDAYPTGHPITGIDAVQDAAVFVAGATESDGQIVTAGGRVLAVAAIGETLTAAIEKAYAGVGQIHFEGMHYRKDIGRVHQ